MLVDPVKPYPANVETRVSS